MPGCEDCPLKGSTKVLGEGSRIISEKDAEVTSKDGKSKWWEHQVVTYSEGEFEVVVVGIAPATVEVRYGRPFVGIAGKILRSTLDQIGLKDYYVTNVLQCAIPSELSDKDKDQAIKCCSDRLLDEVRSKNPKLVIALGNIPLKALSDEDFKITEVEGRVIPGKLCNVLPVVHPAAILRSTDAFPEFADALKSGFNWLSGNYLYPAMPDTVVINNDNFGEVLRIIDNAEVVAIDLETTRNGFYPYGMEPDSIRCICLAVDDKTAYIVPGDSSTLYESHPNYCTDSRLKEVINKSKLIFHNGQFDCGFLKQAGFEPKIFYDTILAHYQIDERPRAHGLKALAKKFLGAPDWEFDIKKYLPYKNSSYDHIPTDVLYKYASFDVVYTWQLYQAFKRDVPLDNKNVFSRLIIPSANMFVDLRHRGVEVDARKIADSDKLLGEDIDKSRDELNELVGYYVNPFSVPEVACLVYDKLGFPASSKYGRTTSKKVLALFRPHPVIDKIIELRELGKLRSTYYMSLVDFLDKDWKIHPLLKLSDSVTGRISAEDPSVLNIKRDSRLKSMYNPSPGNYILDIDQKQMELRIYALLADDKMLKEVFSLGGDPHDEIGKIVKGISGRDWDRTKIKGGVFGGLYGRGEASFQVGFQLSYEDAHQLKSDILSLFPGLEGYRGDIKNLIHAQGYLESYFKRKRRFPFITHENKQAIYRMGTNFPIQSTASDINLFCMLYLYESRSRFGAIPMFPVHDSVVIDLQDKGMIPEIIREVEHFSSELVNGQMHFKVEAKVGPNWGETVEV